MECRFGSYKITSDKYNYMLSEYQGVTLSKDTATEHERWTICGYWGTLEQLVRAMPDRIIRRSNGNLAEAVAEARELSEALLVELRKLNLAEPPEAT